MKFRNALRRFGAACLTFSPMLAFADAGTIDTSTVTAAITAAAAAVGVIGAAVVGGPVVIKATYNWIRGSVH